MFGRFKMKFKYVP